MYKTARKTKTPKASRPVAAEMVEAQFGHQPKAAVRAQTNERPERPMTMANEETGRLVKK
jgi:hypothetical protein